MVDRQAISPVHLFYSYCHKDQQHKTSMEKSLELLKQNGLLQEWSDRSILSGESISEKIRQELDKADIIVFLVSPDFIASAECRKEWEYAKQREENKSLFRIPIILKDCAWKDLLDDDNVKALPVDGRPVTNFRAQNTAWQQVYEGLKLIIRRLRNTFTLKLDFQAEMEETEFLSQKRIKLQEIYVFPVLSSYSARKGDDGTSDDPVVTTKDLLEKKYSIIHGDEGSGKTALGRYLFLGLAKETAPVLFINLQDVPQRHPERFLQDRYQRQFSGDYSLWEQQEDKTLILDNLTSDRHLVDFIVLAKGKFDRIVVLVSSDVFDSFFRDDTRLADFREMRIQPLTRRQQEDLIRKRLELLDTDEPVTEGLIDQLEDRVDSIIISNKVVPRYPFYVLSILQTYEAFMPNNMSITSYGHCYHALIVANLIKAGVSNSDTDINKCFNFAEKLAFALYQRSQQEGRPELDFAKFIEDYRSKYIIADSILNRLKNETYGIINGAGDFRTTYMYYFFLGRFLSKNGDTQRRVIGQMCEKSYLSLNYLTLLFTVHHTDDPRIIDDILLGTMCTLDAVPPSELSSIETKKFSSLVTELKTSILSNNTVETERGKQRDLRDKSDQRDLPEEEPLGSGKENLANQCYRILKNNEIMGQILRNKHGSLEKGRIREIIEVIADGGLRLVNSLLRDEKEIADIADYINKKYPNYDIDEIKRELRFLAFLWTMNNIEKIVHTINVPELSQTVRQIVREKSTPAYDLIGYFYQLDSAMKLSETEKHTLNNLLKKHRDLFVQRVLSLRTQYYMNTHRSSAPLEQAICSLLDVKYLPQRWRRS